MLNLFIYLPLLALFFSPLCTRELDAYIHVGPHKIASTFIQVNLVQNFASFQRSGYQVIGQGRPKAGATFAFELKKKSGQGYNQAFLDAGKYQQMVKQIQAHKTSIVMSSEELDNLSMESTRSLKKILNGYNVKIVIYHRSHDTHLMSWWSEISKGSNSPMTFEKFVATFLTEATGLDLEGLIDRYAQVFGNSSISLVSFEGSVRQSNPFSVFVANVMGLSLNGFTVQKAPANQAPPHILVETFAMAKQHCTKCPITADAQTACTIIQRALPSLPVTCHNLTELHIESTQNDERIFQKYGVEPLFYDKELISDVPKFCQPDITHQKFQDLCTQLSSCRRGGMTKPNKIFRGGMTKPRGGMKKPKKEEWAKIR